MFKILMQVRDYECDLQGVVNNSVYQNYLEHARHKFLQHNNINFSALTKQGIHLMLSHIEINFKASLKPANNFEVQVKLHKKGKLKYLFKQNIVHENGTNILEATATGVALSPTGKPMIFEMLDTILENKTI